MEGQATPVQEKVCETVCSPGSPKAPETPEPQLRPAGARRPYREEGCQGREGDARRLSWNAGHAGNAHDAIISGRGDRQENMKHAGVVAICAILAGCAAQLHGNQATSGGAGTTATSSAVVTSTSGSNFRAGFFSGQPVSPAAPGGQLTVSGSGGSVASIRPPTSRARSVYPWHRCSGGPVPRVPSRASRHRRGGRTSAARSG